MKKKTARKRGRSKKKSRAVPSTHLVGGSADHIRKLVHGALDDAGIHDLSLRAMHFNAVASTDDPCPPNQHREMVCTTGPGGGQVCEWKCVPN
jgi:hypothetical protein